MGAEQIPGPLADIGRAPAEEPVLVLMEASGASSEGAPGASGGGAGGIASSSSSASSASSTRVSAAAPEGHDAASMAFLKWTQAHLSMLPKPTGSCKLCNAAHAICASNTAKIAGSLNVLVSVAAEVSGRPV